MWWSNINSPRNITQTTSPHNSPSKYLSQPQFQQSCTPPETQQQNFSETIQQEIFTSKNIESQQQAKTLQKAIRMDIDFNRPISPKPQLTPIKSEIFLNKKI